MVMNFQGCHSARWQSQCRRERYICWSVVHPGPLGGEWPEILVTDIAQLADGLLPGAKDKIKCKDRRDLMQQISRRRWLLAGQDVSRLSCLCHRLENGGSTDSAVPRELMKESIGVYQTHYKVSVTTWGRVLKHSQAMAWGFLLWGPREGRTGFWGYSVDKVTILINKFRLHTFSSPVQVPSHDASVLKSGCAK